MDLGDGIKAYADNVLVEASFPPCESKEQIVTMLGNVLGRIQERLDKLGNFKLVPQAAHIYDKDQLTDKTAWECGCTPNFDAYGECMNPSPEFSSGLRSGSFHIHLGNKTLTDFDIRHQAIRLLDIFVGVPSIVFDKDKSSGARRALYGKAGEFRPTPYGLEYRVLGNFALRSPKMTNLVFDLVNYAMGHVEIGNCKDVISRFDSKMIQRAINDGDKKLASAIVRKSGLPSNLVTAIHENYDADMYKAWKI